MAVTKLVERCFISDLALVSSPGVACGFRYDSNHRVSSDDDLGSIQKGMIVFKVRLLFNPDNGWELMPSLLLFPLIRC